MSDLNDIRLCEFRQNGDERGHLVIIEGGVDIPFDIKRVFYIYGSDKDVVRGQHANRKSAFLLVNVSGTSKIRAVDTEGNSRVFLMDRPHLGLYLPKMIWKDMYDFSADSVLLVLSDEHYDEHEYIRNYDDFIDCGKRE